MAQFLRVLLVPLRLVLVQTHQPVASHVPALPQ